MESSFLDFLFSNSAKYRKSFLRKRKMMMFPKENWVMAIIIADIGILVDNTRRKGMTEMP
jgi:hypothetical protein